ncbi:sliding clamp loader subunit [Campylobacter phage PC5]|uniref:Sliding-clamp-loader large subunit n=1 Tax=Campylobacter phage PC5 TaxID=1541690 RepID=A0A1B0XVN6_9CAUD|nr:sliding clamp loader subunit [Campylobacter phage PC5]
MKSINEKEYIWAEKYRPSRIDDMILPDQLHLKIKEWINSGEIPNLGFFSNTPGTGKTSLNKAICDELGATHLFINSSKESGVDLARNKITSFASSVSIDGSLKIISLSECDGMTNELQRSIRDIIDEYTQNCRFILTANYTDRLIEPILTRVTCIDFDKEFNDNKTELGVKILDRLEFILQNEKVEYDKKDLQKLIQCFYPCIREMLIVMQHNTVNNKLVIDEKVFENINNYSNLVEALKKKDYTEARKIIAQTVSYSGFYQYLFKNVDKFFELESIPQAVMLIEHYSDHDRTSRDRELCLSALVAALIKYDMKYK